MSTPAGTDFSMSAGEVVIGPHGAGRPVATAVRDRDERVRRRLLACFAEQAVITDLPALRAAALDTTRQHGDRPSGTRQGRAGPPRSRPTARARAGGGGKRESGPRRRGQAEMASRSPLAVMVILRGRAFSLTGTRTLSTPWS